MTVRWGIIGAGAIARKQTAQAIQDSKNGELVSVMRTSLEGAQEFAHEFGASRAYDSVASLLSDRDVDAVYVATPVYLHASHTIAAAEAGKHVLVEKPMALTTAECHEMMRACRDSSVKLMVCYYQRFNARHQKVRELLQDGVIGQVTMAQARQAFLYPPGPGRWRQNPALGGGGAIMDVGVHCIDTLRFVLGEVEAVTALVDTLAFDYLVDDTATLLLRFENGVQGVVSAAFSVARVDEAAIDYLELTGTGGRIWTAPLGAKDSSGEIRVTTPDVEETFSYTQRTHVALIEAFGHSILHREPVPVPGEDGLAGMEIVAAASESAKSGHTVWLG